MDNLEEIRDIIDSVNNKDKTEKTSKKNQDKTAPKEAPVSEGFYMGVVNVDIITLSDDVEVPIYAHEGDACADVRAYHVISITNEYGSEVAIPENFEEVTIHKGWTIKFGAGFKLGIPKGWSVELKVRSGLSTNNGIVLLNGVGEMDNIYQGEYMMSLCNLKNTPYTFKKNEKIGQIKIVPQFKMNFNKVEKFNEVTSRGETGFGDSGKL